MLRIEQGAAPGPHVAGTPIRRGGRAILHLSGSCAIVVEGTERVLANNSLVLVPDGMARSAFRRWQGACLVLDLDPAGAVARALQAGAPVVLDAASELGRIAGDLMRGAYAAQEALGQRQRVGLHRSLEGLLATALQHRDAARTAPRLVEQHCAVVKDFLDARLCDSAIDPRSVAAAHRISVRHLHRIFRATGSSFGGWLRTRRLERCREELATPSLERVGVATIAYRWGFNDAAHFSRLFKRTYGVAPRDYRLTAT